MRVHRITLRHYRGVESCDLTFAERGVTVIAGNNEVGKSSAAEALHLLVEHRDDTTRASVKAVKALHLDQGAEVEAELSVGPYRFVYAKRWHRDRYTRLKVLAPEPEVLTGREAHDRVRALLGQSVDLDLWRALSAPQAAVLDQAALRDHPSLVAALDAAAGGDLGAADDGQLLARAEAEAARWFTPTGRPKAALAELRTEASAAAAEVSACEEAIERLETDVTWCADLQRSADELTARHATAVEAVEAAATHLADVQQRTAELDELAVAAELAGTRATVAANALDARRRLTLDVEAATTAYAETEAVLAGAVAARDETVAERDETEAALTAAELGHRAAVEAATRAGADHGRIRAATALTEIEAHLAAAERDAAALASARTALAASRSSPAALAAVQEAHDDVVRAEATLTAGQASLQVEALGAVELTVDGVAERLTPGAVIDHGVAGELVVELPGVVRLTVAAGAEVAGLRRRLDAATATLTERCAALGVTDLASARALEDERRRLAAEVESCRSALAATLAGTDVETLTARAARARAALDAAEAALAAPCTEVPGRPPERDLDVDRARQVLDEANAARHTAERLVDQRVARAEAASVAAGTAERALATAERQVALAGARVTACTHALDQARTEATDDQLEAALIGARERAGAAERAWRDAEARAAGLDLDGAAQAVRRAGTERAGIERSLAQVKEDLAGVRSRLELQGEGGHHARLADASRTAAEITDKLASVEARAAAARLLVTTLTRHRDEAARAYGAPLRAQIEHLGRLVFGDGFGVVLDDDLRVAARVLDGVPVPWSELSVGAREQLAVLTRLAAATLVSPDGGVPVVFDDVLGFSDPSRLALVSSAFEAAAEHCQIIVFTCDAERYRHLARAVTHHLTAPRGLGARQAG